MYINKKMYKCFFKQTLLFNNNNNNNNNNDNNKECKTPFNTQKIIVLPADKGRASVVMDAENGQ